MAIEEIIHRAVVLRETIKIEYSRKYGAMYIEAFCLNVEEDRTFKISRIMKVNDHSFSRIFWNQIGDNFNRI